MGPGLRSNGDAAQRHRALLQLREALGDSAQLVSLQVDPDQRMRGLAVSAGRLLSFVMHAEEQRLRTRPLLSLLRSSRQA